MNITILDSSKVKYNGHYLQEFQTYNDIDDTTANSLIAAKHAKQVADDIVAVSFASAPESDSTPQFDPKANGGYVGQAVIDPAKKAKLEADGQLNDDTPVIGKDNTQPGDETPEPQVQTQVEDADGHTLSEEELRAKENAAVAAAGSEASEKTPTVGELQDAGQEVK